MNAFFDQLSEFSRRVFQRLNLVEKESPWGGAPFPDGVPRGVIIHSTVSQTIVGSVLWFMHSLQKSKVSAHILIDRTWPTGDWKQLAQDLPLIHALPVMVVQCMPYTRQAWHATWANSSCYGIELVNLGELRATGDGTFRSSIDKWRHVCPPTILPPVRYGDRYWAAYPRGQVETACRVLWHLAQAIAPRKLHSALILGHDNVQGAFTPGAMGRNKTDPGPHFPLPFVRAAHQGNTAEYLEWLDRYAVDVSFMEHARDNIVLSWARHAGVALSSDAQAACVEAWRAYSQRWDAAYLAGQTAFGMVGKVGLWLLGYALDSLSEEEYPLDVESVRVFQTLMGLQVDGVPGAKTRAALQSRLIDRGVAKFNSV